MNLFNHSRLWTSHLWTHTSYGTRWPQDSHTLSSYIGRVMYIGGVGISLCTDSLPMKKLRVCPKISYSVTILSYRILRIIWLHICTVKALTRGMQFIVGQAWGSCIVPYCPYSTTLPTCIHLHNSLIPRFFSPPTVVCKTTGMQRTPGEKAM